MSRSTPRKTRNNGGQQASSTHSHPQPQQRSHHRNRSAQVAAQAMAALISDYESDAATYMRENPPPTKAELASRSNDELNMAVLKRYIPDIESIKSVAGNAVMYTMDMVKCEWMKGGVDGTLFVVTQKDSEWEDPATNWGKNTTQACVFVLNRKGLTNLTLDLAEVASLELNQQLLIFQMDYDGKTRNENGEEKDSVIGLWIHAQDDSTRDTNHSLIEELWKEVKAAKRAKKIAQENATPAPQPMGRKVSISDLFGRGSNSNGGGPL